MFEEEKRAFSDTICFITIFIALHTVFALIRFVFQYMVYDPNAEMNEMILKLESAIFDWVVLVINIFIPFPLSYNITTNNFYIDFWSIFIIILSVSLAYILYNYREQN